MSIGNKKPTNKRPQPKLFPVEPEISNRETNLVEIVGGTIGNILGCRDGHPTL